MNLSNSKPIDIPIKHTKPPRPFKTKPPSPSSSSSQSSSSLNKTDYRSVVLRGAPFKNVNTMKMLITSCIPKISMEKAEEIIEVANQVDRSVLIVCHRDEAALYCSRLIENGLLVDIE